MTSKKPQRPPVPQSDEAQLQHLLVQRHTIAETLRNSSNRVQAETALAEITGNAEGTQLAFLRALAKQQDMDAADVLLAINELAPDKAVRKEARRVLIHLAGSKIYPSWTPEPEHPTGTFVGTRLIASNAPRFWKGQVTVMRELGEVQLTLYWEQGFEYGEVRMMTFLLNFWQHGVKDFYLEVGSKRHIDANTHDLETHLAEATGKTVSITDCTLAEGRRLILDALAVNKWRETTPHKDYRHYLPTIRELVLDAPELDEDRGRTFIDPDLEPDEVAMHFVGAWSMGDYSLCYDLLAADSPIRQELAHDEWVGRRCRWASEALPAHLEVSVIREREHNQNALWLPGSFISDRSGSRREVEMCWSLELAQTPLSGTLLEMPLGTAVLKETARHWFWTNYTLARQEGAWRIQRMSDEGANAQGLPLADIQQRLKEHNDAIQHIMQSKSPTDPDMQQYYEEIIWRSIQAMHYLDALLIKMPLDFDLYADAAGRATSVGQNERAMVYVQKWEQRFPQHLRHTYILQQLGAVESVLAGQYDEAGLEERSHRFYKLADAHLQEALEKEKTALAYILLGEVKTQRGDYDEAQSLLQTALTADPTREEEVEIEQNLGAIATDRQRYNEALRHFMRVTEISPHREKIWYNIARTYRHLKNDVEAEAYYKRAIEEEPQFMPAFAELATIYIDRHELDKAYTIVEQGVRLHPESAHLRGLLAGILLDQGQLRQARAVLEEAERINPDAEIVRAVRHSMDAVKQ